MLNPEQLSVSNYTINGRNIPNAAAPRLAPVFATIVDLQRAELGLDEVVGIEAYASERLLR